MSSVAHLSTREEEARRRDRDDALPTLRDAFEVPVDAAGRERAYLCGNSLGLMPRAARADVLAELDAWARLAVDGHFHARHPWLRYHEEFRDPLARLVGARPAEVVAANTLTVNLHLLMVSFYRPTQARFKILVERGAFPSDLYAVQSQARFHGYDPATAILEAGPRAGEDHLRAEDVEALLAERGHEIALVLLGGVHYYTGQLHDIARLTSAAQRAGCMVGWDLAHAAGNATLALHDWNVDCAAWCSYKYLNAGPGAVAGLFVHERHLANANLPRFAGWWGNDPTTRFQMQAERSFVPLPSADGWQLSNPPILSLAPLRASLELFDRAGMAALRAKSVRLTAYLLELLDSIARAPFSVITPRDPAARGCQLSLRWGARTRDAFAQLEAAGVIGDVRDPDVIRLSPAPLYNTFHDVWRAASAIERITG